MTTWKTSKGTVTDILNYRGYKEIPDNLTENESFMADKLYSFKPLMSIDSTMNDGANIALNGKLKIVYIVKDNDEFDDMFDEFIKIVQLLIKEGIAIISTPIMDRNPNDNTMAIAEVDLGIGQITC